MTDQTTDSRSIAGMVAVDSERKAILRWADDQSVKVSRTEMTDDYVAGYTSALEDLKYALLRREQGIR